jgi:hypothetical protein
MGQEICIKIMIRVCAVYALNLSIYSKTNINISHLTCDIINDIVEPSTVIECQIPINLKKGINYFIVYSDSNIVVNDLSITVGNVIPCQIFVESFNINDVNNHICNNQLNLFDYDITNVMLNIIDKNIESFSRKIKNNKNILFMCTDGPNYGGAGINCSEIQNFYSEHHKTYSIYHTLEKINIKNDNHCIVNVCDIEKIILELDFIPDLVILKNYIPIDIKKYFSCPVYFCVPGLFMESLNKYYYNLKTRTEHDIYIDQNILKQISISDKIFCNSSHSKDILFKFYNIKAELFYSGFVSYYKKRIRIPNDFYTRKYNFAIIVSNVERQIKNVQASIDFIISQNMQNVIVIGKGSYKYADLGFKCIESIPHVQICDILKNTKFVLQDSFYESCSNVKIEANFVGCFVINSNTVIENGLIYKINRNQI